jgi:hypothetical protein
MERAKGFEPSTPTLARLCSRRQRKITAGIYAYLTCDTPQWLVEWFVFNEF